MPPPIKKDNTAYLVYKEQIDNLKLEIERKELLVEHTKQELHDDHEEMRRLQKKMDAAEHRQGGGVDGLGVIPSPTPSPPASTSARRPAAFSS